MAGSSTRQGSDWIVPNPTSGEASRSFSGPKIRTARDVGRRALELDSDNSTVGVIVEHDAGANLFALDNLAFGEAHVQNVGFRIVAAIHDRRPRSKNTVSTRAISLPSGTYTTRSTRPLRSG